MNYILKSEPKNSYFYQLVDLLKIISKHFILIKRDQLYFNDGISSLLEKLSIHLVNKTFSNEWPGTELLDQDKAIIYRYKVNDDTINILKKHSNSLFDWIAPGLPEDLCFFREDDTVILGSITHEKEYWIDLNEAELEIATKKFPNLMKNLIKDTDN